MKAVRLLLSLKFPVRQDSCNEQLLSLAAIMHILGFHDHERKLIADHNISENDIEIETKIMRISESYRQLEAHLASHSAPSTSLSLPDFLVSAANACGLYDAADVLRIRGAVSNMNSRSAS